MVCISRILESTPPPSPLPSNLSQLWGGPCDNFGFALLHPSNVNVKKKQKIFHLRLKRTHCWIFIRHSARGDEMTEEVEDVDVDTEKVHN